MPLAVLEKLEKLVLEGTNLLGPKPSRDASLVNYPGSDEKVQEIAERTWGPDNAKGAPARSHGKGQVISDRNSVRKVLRQQSVDPDFAYSSPTGSADLDYIHRRTAETDIYFVSNSQMEETEADCVFRVETRQVQLWLPDTGDIQSCPDAEPVAGGIKLRLRLTPAGSVFVAFGGTAEPNLAARTTLP